MLSAKKAISLVIKLEMMSKRMIRSGVVLTANRPNS